MIGRAFRQFDLFPAQATLRIGGQTQKVNSCSGIFSFLFYLGFIALAITMVIDIFQYKVIASTSTNKIAEDYSSKITNFPLAVGILGLNISEFSYLFTIEAYNVGKKDQPLTFAPCTMDMLPGISQKDFDEMKLDSYVCLEASEEIQLSGFFTNQDSKYLTIQINPCNEDISGSFCLPPDNISDILSNSKGPLIGSVVPITTGFNPTQINPTFKYTYKDSFYMPFSTISQVSSVSFVSSYLIRSDQSIWPFNDYTLEEGNFIDRTMPIYQLRTNNKDSFFASYIFASPNQIQYERVYGKIDEVFSYIGGLFGIIISIVSIFMTSLNEYNYELEVAQANFSGNEITVQKKGMNFLRYLQYSFFSWMQVFFCCKLNWEVCQAIQSSRNEAIGQLEVGQLIRRMSNLENIVTKINKEEDLDIIYYMRQRETLQRASRNRKIKEYIDKMNKQQDNLSINELETLKNEASESNMFSLNKQDYYSSHFQNVCLNQKVKNERDIETQLNRHLQRCMKIIQNIQLNEEDLEALAQLTKIFQRLDQKTRNEIYREMPIGLLYHISMSKSVGEQKNKENPSELRNIKVEEYVSEYSV